jgi:Leu/Phe-tRNA-protein transferase
MLQRRTDRTFVFLEELQIKKKLKKRKKGIRIENNFSKDLDSTCSRKQSNQQRKITKDLPT